MERNLLTKDPVAGLVFNSTDHIRRQTELTINDPATLCTNQMGVRLGAIAVIMAVIP